MIGCDRAIALLGEYVDGDLSPPEQVLMDRHLSSCPSCQKEAAGYLAVILVAGSLPQPTPSSAAERRLRRLIRDAVQTGSHGDEALNDTKPDWPVD